MCVCVCGCLSDETGVKIRGHKSIIREASSTHNRKKLELKVLKFLLIQLNSNKVGYLESEKK